ncbi:MAG: DUF3105 domain-containing protein [Nostocoides sp.]
MAKKTTNPADAERRARLAALAKAQAAKQRRRTMMIAGGSALIIVAIVVAIVVAIKSDKKATTASAAQVVPSAVTGTTTVEQKVDTVPNTTGVDGVIAYDTAGYPGPGTAGVGTLTHDHVPGPVTYSVVPPVGGPHNATWMNAGIYTVPVPTERAVHNLEHGAVWITYRPNLPAADLSTLTDLVLKQTMIDEGAGASNRFMDLTPWASNDLSSPIVISSWGYQLKVDSATDPRLQKFIDTFRHSQKYAPEYGSPVDGVPVDVGGRPAKD